MKILFTLLLGSALFLGSANSIKTVEPTKLESPRHAVASESLAGEGTEESPYLIQSESDLMLIRNNVDTGSDYANNHLKVTTDISITLTATTNGKTFRGHLDGDGHTITLASTQNAAACVLFNCVGGVAVVENLTFEGSMTNTGNSLATICHYNYGTIRNCVNYCELGNTTIDNVGAFAAQQIDAAASIDNCINYADVAGSRYVGGIVGNLRLGTVSDCVNYGDIYAANTSVGGIVGLGGRSQTTSNNFIIDNCINYGDIEGNQIGGIVGGTYGGNSSITNSSNFGNITCDGNAGAGGILGFVNDQCTTVNTITITNCVSAANISGTSGWIGGFFGYASSASTTKLVISDSVAFSNISNTDSTTNNVGGFAAGQNATKATLSFTDCYFAGSLTLASATGSFGTGVAFDKTNVTVTGGNLTLNNQLLGTSVSTKLFEVVQMIEEFDCTTSESEATAYVTAYQALTSDDLSALNQAVDFSNYDDQTYAKAADYLYTYHSNGGVSYLSGFNSILNNNNGVINVVTISSIIVIFAAIILLTIRRRQRQ